MLEILQTIWQIITLIGVLVVALLWFALRWSPVIAWIAFWLWGADWRKVWPALARGAWAPVVLLAVMIAFAWSALAPSEWPIGGLVFPNFVWQLLAVTDFLLIAGFCGWLQLVLRWSPDEIELHPAVAETHEHH